MHCVAPAVPAYVPAGQALHTVALGVLVNVPAAQTPQTRLLVGVLAVCANEPAAHVVAAVHAVAPEVETNVPAPHAVQAARRWRC